MDKPIVQSLWIDIDGNGLSDMEWLSINSFLLNDNEYHLYTYNNPTVPPGTKLMDANEILPEDQIFTYQVGPGKGSPSAYSNLFRYKLLHERGNWWVDTDFVCLRQFVFGLGVVFASETHGGNHITSGVIKAPAGWPMFKELYESVDEMDKTTLEWGQIGPSLMQYKVIDGKQEKYVAEAKVFCPISWYDAPQKFIEPDPYTSIADYKSNGTYAIHLWNEMWRRTNTRKNANHHSDSLYAKLREEYL